MQHTAHAELTAACNEPFAQLGQQRERDAGTVVVAWPSVPAEIVRAAGFRMVLARSGTAPTPMADAHLEAGVFPGRLRHLVEAALTGRLAHVAAIVVPRTSEPDYKCFLYLREFIRQGVGGPYPPILLLDLLQSNGPAIAAYDRERLGELFEQLIRLRGARPVADDLAAEVQRANRARASGRRLQALRADAARLTGAEAMQLLGAFWQLPADRYAELADSVADATVPPAATGSRVRVLIAGAPVDTPALHEAIEAHGAIVVDEITPCGSDAVRRDVVLSADPLLALAQHYRAMPGTPRIPVHTMLQRFDDAVADIDAVIITLPPDDATFGWDYPRLRDRLARPSIPHTVLTADPAQELPPRVSQMISTMLDTLTQPPARRHG